MAADKDNSDMHKKRRGRNIALAAVIFTVAGLFYVISIVRMSSGVGS